MHARKRDDSAGRSGTSEREDLRQRVSRAALTPPADGLVKCAEQQGGTYLQQQDADMRRVPTRGVKRDVACVMGAASRSGSHALPNGSTVARTGRLDTRHTRTRPATGEPRCDATWRGRLLLRWRRSDSPSGLRAQARSPRWGSAPDWRTTPDLPYAAALAAADRATERATVSFTACHRRSVGPAPG
jgi:hypothetical protein